MRPLGNVRHRSLEDMIVGALGPEAAVKFTAELIQASKASEGWRVRLDRRRKGSRGAWCDQNAQYTSTGFRITRSDAVRLIDAGAMALDGGEDGDLVATRALMDAMHRERWNAADTDPRRMVKGRTVPGAEGAPMLLGAILIPSDRDTEPFFIDQESLKDKEASLAAGSGWSYAMPAYALEGYAWPIGRPHAASGIPMDMLPEAWKDVAEASDETLERTAMAINALDAMMNMDPGFDLTPWVSA